MYIIYNNDGSVKKINLTDYIQKGNNNVNSIFLGIEGKTNVQWAATVYFTLPSGDVVDPEVITPTTANQTIDARNYSGWVVSIPSAVTVYEGIVKFSVSVSDLNDNVLFTYEGKLIINPSSVVPNETKILLSQYQSLLNLVNQKNAITSSIVATNNISALDLSGYEVGQIFFDKSTEYFYEKTSDSYQKIESYVESVNTSKIVYGTDSNGDPIQIVYGKLVNANSIVQRDENGQITVAEEPQTDSDATSKKYVDDTTSDTITQELQYYATKEELYDSIGAINLALADLNNGEGI